MQICDFNYLVLKKMSKIFILEKNVFSSNVAGETGCPAYVGKIKSTPISISHHMHQSPKCEKPNTETARKKKMVLYIM